MFNRCSFALAISFACLALTACDTPTNKINNVSQDLSTNTNSGNTKVTTVAPVSTGTGNTQPVNTGSGSQTVNSGSNSQIINTGSGTQPVNKGSGNQTVNIYGPSQPNANANTNQPSKREIHY